MKAVGASTPSLRLVSGLPPTLTSYFASRCIGTVGAKEVGLRAI